MNAHALQSKGTLLSLFATIVGFLVLAATNRAAAQGWEEVYGNRNCKDAGWAVTPVCDCGTDRSHGYTVAGETFSGAYFSFGCNQNSDIYVAKRNPNGTVVWAYSYDIGGNDSALDIKQCKFSQGYVVVGVTDNANIYCNYDRALFIMKLGCDGSMQWVQTYGLPDPGDDVAAEVIETQVGPAWPASPGDFVVAGWCYNLGTGNRDAYLLRVSNAGIIISDMLIDLGDDDYFYGLDEASNGDIIAAGTTRIQGLGLQGLLVRTGGMLSSMAPGLIWAQHYGGEGDEEFRSVQELTVAPNAGNIAVTGYSTTNLPSADVYAVVANSSGNCITSRTYGWSNWDEGYAIREVNEQACDQAVGQECPLTPVGSLIIAGRADLPFGLGGDDVLAMEVPPTLGTAKVALYGGTGTDWGRSIAYDPLGSDHTGSPAPGFVICGFTQSGLDNCYPGDPEQLYLVRPNCSWQTGCDRLGTLPPMEAPCDIPAQPSTTTVEHKCASYAYRYPMYRKNIICPIHGDCAQPYYKPIPGGDMDGSQIGSDVDIASSPNPVRKGEQFTLDYGVAQESAITVTAFDVTGTMVYRSGTTYPAGTNRIAVSTEGWASGVYMVVIDNGTSSKVSQVLVQEK